MDKRKKRESLLPVDELALVKSAAWAWHQHGSDHDGRSIDEFEVSRTNFESKPSRYKLEALRSAAQEASNSSSKKTMSSPRSSTTRASNSLLDGYEIEWISRQLDYYIESSHAKNHGNGSSGRRPEVMDGTKNKVVAPKKNLKTRFWLRHGVVCGSSRDDVVESKSFEHPRRSRPERGRVSAEVEVVGCGPQRRSLVANQIGQVGLL